MVTCEEQNIKLLVCSIWLMRKLCKKMVLSIGKLEAEIQKWLEAISKTLGGRSPVRV